jgi:hypothetical protein
MSELICTKQLADAFGIAEALAANYIAAAKLKSQKLVIGKEAMTLFDKDEATRAIMTRVEEEKKIQAANLARLEAAKIPTLKDVMVAIKALAGDVSDVAEMEAEIKRLTAANKIIFDALKEFKAQTQDSLAGLKNLVVNMRDEASSCKEVTAPVKETLRRVAVVGVSRMHHSALAAEFEGLLVLKLLDPSDIRGIYALRDYDKVFLMKQATDHGHADQLKSIKVQVVPVHGSLDELKEKLTAYCVE